jgi:NAD-dependent deacetylase
MTPSATSTDAARLADLLEQAERAVVLTGAGISVPSGIPDFRTPGKGLWEKVDPMKVAHIDAFRSSPDEFWTFYGQRFAMLSEIRPNPAHEAVAELERRGIVRGVITQNIDRLHRGAGSENVIEVHGSIEWCVCEMCGGKVGYDDVSTMLANGTHTPECATCITPLKPNVVLFGEMLPEDAMADATALATEADLMLCIGSSLEVYPVAGLPGLTLDKGGRIALVTQGRTPYDREAEVKLSGDVVAELDAVLAALPA